MTKVIAGLVVGVILPLIALTLLIGGGGESSAGALALCVLGGPVAGLDDEQAANARLIVADVQNTVPKSNSNDVAPAAIIALMTAYQESKLRDLANPNVTGSNQQPGASG